MRHMQDIGCPKSEDSNMQKVKKIFDVVTTVLVTLVVVLALLLVGARVVGLRVFTVLSGSMEPTYSPGDLIYVRSIDTENVAREVEPGMPLTFVLNEDLVVATHRVVEIDLEKQHIYTKGDANDTTDAVPVRFENVIGTPVFSIPWLGYVSSYIQSPPGSYIAIAGGAILLILVFLPDLFSKKQTEVTQNNENDTTKERGNEE